jgi:uncharacterized membrane protein YqjE
MTENPARHAADRRDAGELAMQIARHVRVLARSEVELVTGDARRRLRDLGSGAAFLLLALLMATLGVMCALAAALIAMTDAIGRPWFAAIIGTAALFLTALVVVLPGWRGVMERRPMLISVRRSVHADVEAIRKAAHRS